MDARLIGAVLRRRAALVAAGVVLAAGSPLVAGPAAVAAPGSSAGAARGATTTAQPLPQPGDDGLTPVMVGAGGADEALVDAVERAGGRVTRALPIIDARAALVPGAALARLAADPAVAWLVPDGEVTLSHAPNADGPHQAMGPTSMFHVADTVRAKPLWERGVTGAGVDVAVIDSGVVPVEGLSAPGKVVNGPDLSFESGRDEVRHLDGFGHGTHIAGIIAGRDSAVPSPTREVPHDAFAGLAPDARVVNVKVADGAGATDVSQVIAGIDWVVQHGRSNGLNIRVLNLSFGTDGIQDHLLDPLSHAVERAWHRGVVVVVAAGNEGFGNAEVNNPARNPYVIAVGGSDGRGTVQRDDDVVAAWSSRGDDRRRPDLVAPGQSLIGLRDPGSFLDAQHPQARVGDRFFRGSGTSQAAGVVSGAAALLLQQRPQLTPDQVKALLTGTAHRLPEADAAAQGAGLLDVAAAAGAPVPTATQTWRRSVGTGSLDGARGSVRVGVDGKPLIGETSVFLTTWEAVGWASSLLDDALLGGLLPAGPWSGGTWSGQSWTGSSWTGGTWSGNSWAGGTWSGGTWSGGTWSGGTWSGGTWSGGTWSGGTWSGGTWSGGTWSGDRWSSAGW